MPVRSLTSRVLKWPDAGTVDQAARRWAARMAQEHSEVVRIGYFGSYARGDWGVGSDLDIIIMLRHLEVPYERRGAGWTRSELPVPADLLFYSQDEWRALPREGRFYRTLLREAVWVYPTPPPIQGRVT